MLKNLSFSINAKFTDVCMAVWGGVPISHTNVDKCSLNFYVIFLVLLTISLSHEFQVFTMINNVANKDSPVSLLKMNCTRSS